MTHPKLTKNELEELKYHYVDRLVDNMSTKDLVNYCLLYTSDAADE